MPDTLVRTDTGDGWAKVTLHTPDGLNRLGTGTLTMLHDELSSVLSGDCRCLSIVGEGRSFAVGADLREIRKMTPTKARRFSDLANGIFRLLENSNAAVIAGIDGFCLGGGFDLALAADWRMATGRSTFGHPGADLGLVTGFGGTQKLPRLVGRHRAARWLFTGERISADQAYNAGILQEVCKEEEFGRILMARVKQFTARPSGWIETVKECLRYNSEGWKYF